MQGGNPGQQIGGTAKLFGIGQEQGLNGLGLPLGINSGDIPKNFLTLTTTVEI